MPTFPFAQRLKELDAYFRNQDARLERECAAEMAAPTTGATAAGDERKLRGIPVIGRGVAGDMGEATTDLPRKRRAS